MKYGCIFQRKTRLMKGSREHYFHFMLGFLLPLIHSIHTGTDTKNSTYFIETCGPVMDKIIHEVMEKLKYSYRIVDGKFINEENFDRLIIPDRWDGKLREINAHNISFKDHYYKRKHVFRAMVLNLLPWERVKRHKLLSELDDSFSLTKKIILKRFKPKEDDLYYEKYRDYYILLQRSPEPEFYAKGNKAEISTYGTSRRSLVDVEKAIEALNQKNIPIKLFEPGRYPLATQITVFNACKGVVGIQGAELVNVFWMEPARSVILIKPPMRSAIHRVMASLLNLKYHEVKVDSMFPKLDTEKIASILESQ